MNTDNIKLGPCKVVFGEDNDPNKVVLETTQGGVVLTYEETSREVTMDQTGTTPIKEIITGRTATVAVPFGEYDQDILLQILPGSKQVVSATDPDRKQVIVNATKVIDLIKFAKKMTLIPLAEGTTENDHVVIYRAAPRTTLNYTYSYDNELITNTTFKAYPNDDGDLISFGSDVA
ncbi:hypothetical protein [Paenibacillus sp. FSL R5-808]|jgi:hypothetical protein|uniref:hypothetical protein n=1 Tax=Paenibacillus sp. FSL R5-808 TaxID=1227076 RepID=UPI0003E276D5|nr:hypothetical protein [Paenibacillus sp. FSL R5-808]ETT33273.1 hypothetical protein C169_22795 [Paenibacillus sp. FSL R5-808]